MPSVNIKRLVDLYQRAKNKQDVYLLSHAEAAIEAAKDAEASLRRLSVSEAVVEEGLLSDKRS